MNERIKELALQAGINSPDGFKLTVNHMAIFTLEAFAALVAAHERERIEKAWDKLYGWWESDDETKTRGTT
jgi:DNA gyrase inhibitor GyrI